MSLANGARRTAPSASFRSISRDDDAHALSDDGDDEGEGDIAEAQVAPGRKRTRRKRQVNTNSGEGRTEAFKLEFEKDLELPGLREFYSRWIPKSHVEKVLIFAQFLKERGYDPCTANQINTCYATLRLQRPKVFLQALRDAHGAKHGVLNYKSPTDIVVNTIGEDCLWHHLKKAGEE